MYFIFGNLSPILTLKPVSLRVQKSQSRDKKLKERWDQLLIVLTERFSDGEAMDVEGFVFDQF